MPTRALAIRNAVLDALRAAAPGGVLADRIHTDLRQALGKNQRPAIVVDMGDEDAPEADYSQRRRALALTVRLLADGSDPFTVLDPIRQAVQATIMGARQAPGRISGGAVTPSVQADKVDVAALTAMLGSLVVSVDAATGLTVTRPETDVAKINSVIVTGAGALAVVAGADGVPGEPGEEGEEDAPSAFSLVRGAAGGPPSLPTGSIEIAQIRLTTAAPGVIEAGAITLAGVTLRALIDRMEEGPTSRERADLDVPLGALTTVYRATYSTVGDDLT